MVNEVYSHEVKDKIHIFTFTNQAALTEMFMRVQEYYEGAYTKGKLDITHQEVMDAYEATGVTWDNFCSGWNVPASALDEFFWPEGEYNICIPRAGNTRKDASPREKVLANHYEPGAYYIGVMEGEPYVLQHEMAHALYATDSKYYQDVSDKMDDFILPTKVTLLYDAFKAFNYHPEVWRDELHAYVLDNTLYDIIDGPFCKEVDQLRKDFYPLHIQLVESYLEALHRLGD